MATPQDVSEETIRSFVNSTNICIKSHRVYRVGTVTPNYRQIPRVDLPINSYLHEQMRVQHQPGLQPFTRLDNGQTGTQVWGYATGGAVRTELASTAAHAIATLRSVADLRNECLIEALNRLSDQKANLPVTLLEAHKTSSLILDSANRIYKAMSYVRRGRFRDASRVLDLPIGRVHKNWLQYKYGWMPLLMEVKGAAEFLAQRMIERPTRLTSSATRTSQGKLDFTLNNNYGWDGANRTTIVGHYVAFRQVSVKLRAVVDSPHLAATQQLGLTNPLLVAWEVVPYSFVFDWFLQVGNYLQACTALHGLSIDKAMTQVLTTWTGGHSWASPGYFVLPTYQYHPYNAEVIGTMRQYQRDPLSVSSVGLRPVVNRDPFSFGKLVTSLALVRSNFKTPPRGVRF